MHDIIQLEDKEPFATQVKDLCAELRLTYAHAGTIGDFASLVMREDEHPRLYILDAHVPFIPGANPSFVLSEAYNTIKRFRGEILILIYASEPNSSSINSFIETNSLNSDIVIEKEREHHHNLEIKVREMLNL